MKMAGISLFDTHRVFCFICASDANATFSPVSTLASPSHGRGCPRSSRAANAVSRACLWHSVVHPASWHPSQAPTLLLYRRAPFLKYAVKVTAVWVMVAMYTDIATEGTRGVSSGLETLGADSFTVLV